MPEPMKPSEAWALVNNETGEVTELLLAWSEKSATEWAAKWATKSQRLARVRIVEVEEPKP